MQPSPDDKIWLVKSSQSILGPWNRKELIQALQQRRVSVIDEVKSPLSRWSFIRDNVDLKEILEKIRLEDLEQIEKTRVILENTKSVTDATLTAEVTPIPQSMTDNTLRTVQGMDRLSRSDATAYGSAADPLLQGRLTQKINSTRNWIFGFSFLLIIAATLMLTREYKKKSSPQVLQNYLKSGDRFYELGFFEKSLEFYIKFENESALDFDRKIKKVGLLIQIPKQTVEARRILDNLGEANGLSAESRLQIDFWRAFSYLKEGQYLNAEEQFEKLLARDFKPREVKYNLLVSQYLKGDFKKVFDSISILESRSTGPIPADLILLKALSVLKDPTSFSESAKLQLVRDLKFYMRSDREWSNEKMILTLGLESLLGNLKNATALTQQLLEQKPVESRSFVRRIEKEDSYLSWDRLFFLCEQAKVSLEEVPGISLMAYCQFSRDDSSTAIDLLEDLLKRQPKNQTLINLLGAIYLAQGRSAQAKALLNSSGQSDSILRKLLQAQLCLGEKEYPCVNVQTLELLKKDPFLPEAYYLRSLYFREINQKNLSRQLIDEALKKIGPYRPILELREDLDEK